jgi:hypothetical protein
VWRSVFDVDQTIQRLPWTGPIQDLWEDLQALENSVSTAEQLSVIDSVSKNKLRNITKDVVEATRENLVIGQA